MLTPKFGDRHFLLRTSFLKTDPDHLSYLKHWEGRLMMDIFDCSVFEEAHVMALEESRIDWTAPFAHTESVSFVADVSRRYERPSATSYAYLVAMICPLL